MTPKEKAQDLIETFTFNCRECDNAMLSAQFAVNEIVKEIQCNAFDFGATVPMVVYTYWKNVKEEIEKL
jgi:hypothetical protein